MSAVGDIADRKERPAYVRFERLPVEDKAKSLEQGRFVAKDVDYALITPPYSKDVVRIKVIQWFQNMEQDVGSGRLAPEWRDSYRKAYEAFQRGEELPPNGTPIKSWGVISPAQREMLIRINILTVEDLAGINDEGVRRIGMGALELKNKAIAWLRTLNERGPMTQEMAKLQTENTQLAASVESLQRQLTDLAARIPSGPLVQAVVETDSIQADDILPEDEPQPQRRARR